MVYFPLLNFNSSFRPSTSIYNFSPNNYQSSRKISRHLYLHYSDGSAWHSHFIKTLLPGCSLTITPDSFDFDIFCLHGTYLALYSSPISDFNKFLPEPVNHISDTLPAWRASVSISHRSGAFTSYQGEIYPFPSKATLLSFNYFTQPPSTLNYLLFMSLESDPSIRSAELGFYRPKDSSSPFYSCQIFTNTINSIKLPDLFNSDDLICVKSDDCSGIPLFLSFCPSSSSLSLEHTHPPASLAIHGNRFVAQKLLKEAWFNFLN